MANASEVKSDPQSPIEHRTYFRVSLSKTITSVLERLKNTCAIHVIKCAW